METIDIYLENLHEGKKWDATKKFLGKHKGKIIAGAAAIAIGSRIAKSKYKNSPTNKPTTAAFSGTKESPIKDLQNHVNKTKSTTSSSSYKKADNFFDKKSEIKRLRLKNAADSISHCPVVNGKRSATRKMGKVVCNT